MTRADCHQDHAKEHRTVFRTEMIEEWLDVHSLHENVVIYKRYTTCIALIGNPLIFALSQKSILIR